MFYFVSAFQCCALIVMVFALFCYLFGVALLGLGFLGFFVVMLLNGFNG